jgi:hypothetical protein
MRRLRNSPMARPPRHAPSAARSHRISSPGSPPVIASPKNPHAGGLRRAGHSPHRTERGWEVHPPSNHLRISPFAVGLDQGRAFDLAAALAALPRDPDGQTAPDDPEGTPSPERAVMAAERLAAQVRAWCRDRMAFRAAFVLPGGRGARVSGVHHGGLVRPSRRQLRGCL